MERITRNMQEPTDYVLMGGTALLLARGLTRHSTDLDFRGTRKVDLEKIIRSSFEDFREEGYQIKTLRTRADTEMKQRYMVHYSGPDAGESAHIKIESFFRGSPRAEHVEVVDGIRVYKIEQAFEQKMAALNGRVVARDLYDVGFIVRKFGDRLDDRQLEEIDKFSKDIDDVDDLFKGAFAQDALFSRIADSETVVLDLREAVENRIRQRELNALSRDNLRQSDASISVMTDLKIQNERAELAKALPDDGELQKFIKPDPRHAYQAPIAEPESGRVQEIARDALAEIREHAGRVGIRGDLLVERYRAVQEVGGISEGLADHWVKSEYGQAMTDGGLTIDQARQAIPELHRTVDAVYDRASREIARGRQRDDGGFSL